MPLLVTIDEDGKLDLNGLIPPGEQRTLHRDAAGRIILSPMAYTPAPSTLFSEAAAQ